jgi:Flp pilus assembly protein TadD
MKFCLAALLAIPLIAQTPEACRELRHHGKFPEAQTCFTRLAHSGDPFHRAEGLWGLDQFKDASDFKDANEQFRLALKEHPDGVEIRDRWGRFFLERYNRDEAEGLFQEALKLKKDDAGAYIGLALTASEGFSSKAIEFAEKAAELNSKSAEPHEVLAYLALEDNNPDRAAKEADKALEISNEALDAMAIHAAIDWLNDKKTTPWEDRVLKINPLYGEMYETAGHFFIINRRYVDGIANYRKALDLNPHLWEARAQLGVNLMRLGDEDGARQQLEICYNGGYRNAEAVNTLTLIDSYKKFDTFKTNNTILRVNKKEADLLHPYFETEMKRAIAAYEKKYGYKLPGPVQVEVYPDHDDFAVRTLGLPGLGGVLGVTFGAVVAMDSPSGRTPGSFHWASTLWHEMSHVYVLQETNFKVPRWFTEGLAVYEETAVAPDWGDRLDPDTVLAIKNKKLLPVADLDRGFIRPSYPTQVVVSYFEAGKVCSFIAEKWGYSKLVAMVHSFGQGKTTPEAIRENLGMSPEELDKQFFPWLDAQTKTTVDHLDEWKKGVKQMSEDLGAKKYDDVIREGKAIRDFYPDYVEAGSVYEFLADAYLEKGDKAGARAELERYNGVGGRSPYLIKKLATLEEEAGDPKKAAAALDRLNYIYPEDEELHRRLGDLWLAQNNVTGAIREYKALIALKPIDPAASHYQLAKAYQVANRRGEARDEVLAALEAAPGYKPAQRLLLELSK